MTRMVWSLRAHPNGINNWTRRPRIQSRIRKMWCKWFEHIFGNNISVESFGFSSHLYPAFHNFLRKIIIENFPKKSQKPEYYSILIVPREIRNYLSTFGFDEPKKNYRNRKMKFLISKNFLKSKSEILIRIITENSFRIEKMKKIFI